MLIIDNTAEKGDIDLLGDRRCNFPGFNAKHGAHTVLDKNSGLMLDFNVSHVRIAGNPVQIKLDGLKQVSSTLKDMAFWFQVLPLIDLRKSVITCIKRSVK